MSKLHVTFRGLAAFVPVAGGEERPPTLVAVVVDSEEAGVSERHVPALTFDAAALRAAYRCDDERACPDGPETVATTGGGLLGIWRISGLELAVALEREPLDVVLGDLRVPGDGRIRAECLTGPGTGQGVAARFAITAGTARSHYRPDATTVTCVLTTSGSGGVTIEASRLGGGRVATLELTPRAEEGAAIQIGISNLPASPDLGGNHQHAYRRLLQNPDSEPHEHGNAVGGIDHGCDPVQMR